MAPEPVELVAPAAPVAQAAAATYAAELVTYTAAMTTYAAELASYTAAVERLAAARAAILASADPADEVQLMLALFRWTTILLPGTGGRWDLRALPTTSFPNLILSKSVCAF
jgi:hypothetical protein